MYTKSKQANDIILKENDRFISDKREIANVLNDYCVHIADSSSSSSNFIEFPLRGSSDLIYKMEKRKKKAKKTNLQT